jgi:5-methylcytosine-specific restriction enzyme B
MARYSEHDSGDIYKLAASWKTKCLLEGGSLLWEGEQVWTKETLEAFKACFTDRPDESGDSFEEKFKRQLAGEDANVTKLAAELVLVYFLFPSRASVSGARKRELVKEILSWETIELSNAAEGIMKPLDEGIGGVGQAYNTRRPLEIAFIAEIALRLAVLPNEERRDLLADHTNLRALFDEVEGDSKRQSRDILLHLLFPDGYERIASRSHKQLIVDTFADVLENAQSPEDIDDRIYAIRERLERLLPGKELDFYWEPLCECWYVTGESDDLEPLHGLRIKKQIVFYGPPGTGKTYEARGLADRLVRQGLLRKWGPNRYFSDQSVDKIVKDRTRRVQFHPGYSYEDFIRGLQLIDGGKTEYRPGVLLQTIEKMHDDPDDLKGVPLVVILDEMNRADLSRVLGECFSLMEDREEPVQLAGQDKTPQEISFPENLFFIGTMNLIDQSLEQVDFALRRRFLWFFRGYDRQQFLDVAEHRWKRLRSQSRISRDWERYATEFETLADRAEALNTLIERHPSLGNQYQIGHTYFCDVVSFIEQDLATGNKQRVLFSRRGEGRDETIGALWHYSLSPLLGQYLSGIDSAERQAFLRKAEGFIRQGADKS